MADAILRSLIRQGRPRTSLAPGTLGFQVPAALTAAGDVAYNSLFAFMQRPGWLLPTPHTPTPAVTYYIDPVSGADGAAGTSGAPWQTLAGAISNLGTLTWPVIGDVVLALRAGTYQGASGDQQTVEITFNNTNRRPHQNRWLVIQPDVGVDRADVVIKPPSGATGSKNAVKTYDSGTSWFGEYVQLRDLTIDGEATRKGNGDTVGVYVNQTPNFQVVRCHIKGIKAGDTSPTPTSKAQGIFGDTTSTGLLVWQCLIEDVGTTTGTINIQEHGIYAGGHGSAIIGNVIHTIPNGFAIQVYNGSPIDDVIVAANTVVAGSGIEKSCLVVPGSGSRQRIINNIFQGATEYGVEFVPATFTGTGNVISNNIMHSNGSGARSHASPAGWTITNESTADPLLVSPPSDVHPGTGSPAIDAASQAYSPTADYEGTVWTVADIGALEFTAAGGQSVAITFAAETDTAQALVHAKRKAIGFPTETDTALTLGRVKRRAITFATETDTALALNRRKVKAISFASESDAAQPLTRVKRKTISLATETDTALTMTRAAGLSASITFAAETDSASTLGRVKSRAITLAAETDSAQAITRTKRQAISFATETDTTLPLGRLKARTITFATETDTAFAVGRIKRASILLAAELDTAQPITAQQPKFILVTTATELDNALSVSAIGGSGGGSSNPGNPRSGWFRHYHKRRKHGR